MFSDFNKVQGFGIGFGIVGNFFEGSKWGDICGGVFVSGVMEGVGMGVVFGLWGMGIGVVVGGFKFLFECVVYNC